MAYKRSIALERRIAVYPDIVPYYPGKVSSIQMIEGYKNLYACKSKSETVDRLVSIAFNTMTPQELERIRSHAKQED